MSQIALPLDSETRGPARVIVGEGNARVADALLDPERWPYRTAVLTGPPRSGKSLLARWFVSSGDGDTLDDAHMLAEDEVFHRWNRAQESGRALLIVGGEPPWDIALPDLSSRLGSALQLEIGAPDDEMAKELLLSMAAERGLNLPPEAAEYLVPRADRSYAALEKLALAIDRLSLERKTAPTLGIWRAALEAVQGPDEPRLL